MSPAFFDSVGAPPQTTTVHNPTCNGQSSLSSHSFESLNYHHSIAPSTFLDRNNMDPKFGFNSPALGTSTKPGLSSSRIPRRKKPTPAPHSRSSSLRSDPGFNPFRSALETGSGSCHREPGSSGFSSDAFSFGAQRSDDHFGGSHYSNISGLSVDGYLEKNAVADEISKLRIESERNANISERASKNSSERDESLHFELADEMTQLNIDNEKHPRSLGAELQDKIKKLDIQDHTNNPSLKFLDNMLPDKLKNLNVAQENENVDVPLRDKNISVSENVKNPDEVLDGAEKLKKESGYADNSGKMNLSFSSFGEKVNDMQNLGGENRPNVTFSGASLPSFSGSAQPGSVSSSQVNTEDQSTGTSVSSGIHFQGIGNAFEASFQDGAEKKVQFSFTGKWDDTKIHSVEFKTPNIKGTLNRKVDTKRESARGTRSKKNKGKLKKPSPAQLNPVQDFVIEDSQENEDSCEPYSPMDISPYHESLADDVFSRETSVASDEVFGLDDNSTSAEPCSAVLNSSRDEDLADTTKELVINEYEKYEESKEEESAYCSDKGVNIQGPWEESISGAETESFISAADHLDYGTESFITAADTLATASDTEVSSSPMIRRQDSDGGDQCNFASNLEETGQRNFIFAASSAAQRQSSTTSRYNKKKSRTKNGCASTSSTKDPYTSSRVEYFPISGNSTLLSSRQGNLSTCLNQRSDDPVPVKKQEAKKEAISSTTSSMEAQEACEKWRLR